MANKVALVHSSIWEDPDFLARTAAAQRLYLLLVSQKDISLCGLVMMAPNRWARLSVDTKAAGVVKALRELERARFVVTDQSRDEVLIRTYPRWAGTLKKPNVIIGMSKQYALIQSERLRAVVVEELPASTLAGIPEESRQFIAEPFLTDFTTAKGNPWGKGSPKGSANGSPQPFAEETPEGFGGPLDRLTAGPVLESVGTSSVLPPTGSDPEVERKTIGWLRSAS